MPAIHPLRRALRGMLPARRPPRRTLRVQHLGFERREVDTLSGLLDGVASELDLDLRLDGAAGEIVLAERGFVDRIAPQVLGAFLEERPLLMVDAAAMSPNDGGSVGEARQRAQGLRAELLRRLQAFTQTPIAAGQAQALPTRLQEASGFDSRLDSRDPTLLSDAQPLEADAAELLNRLRCGLVDPTQAPLLASYGAGAAMRFDFAHGSVQIDALAEPHLRSLRALPQLAQALPPSSDAGQRDLDLVAWDLAQAARHQRLLHAPEDWWNTPLLALAGIDVRRYTQQPQQLALARELAQGPVAPAELRRRCRVSVAELRGFLQAVLFLGVAQWLASPPALSSSVDRS